MPHGAPPTSGTIDPAATPAQAQATMVGAAGDALSDAPASAGVTLLPRVLGASPIAVLLVDRTSSQVIYANTAALALAGDVGLPVDIEKWSTSAGVTDLDGTALGATAGPLSLVAAGQPVAGEAMRIRGTTDAVRDDGQADGGPVVWATGFPLGPDGEGDQLSLVVFLPVEQPDGVTDPEQVLQALRDRAVLATDIAFTISDPHQEGNPLVWVNPSFTRATGYSLDEAIGRNCKFLQGPATDPAAVATIVDDLTAGRSTSVTLLNYRRDGTAFWNHLSISPVLDGQGDLVSFVGVQSDVTTRIVADAERDAALAAERRARGLADAQRAAVEASRARLAVMAEASSVLTDSLDPAELQSRLAELCVPLLADWVAIIGIDDAQVVTTMTTRHRDGEVERPALDLVQAEYLGRALPPTLAAALAMDSGDAVALSPAGEDSLIPQNRIHPDLGHLTQLGAGSVLAVPLAARTGTWGAIVLVRRAVDGFDDDDLDVALDLGRRAGQALGNARTYTREASVAEALQRALLPDLPRLPGITAAARYTAASASAAVGGDFYDLLALPDDTMGVVIGDVAGHDIVAAAAMGQLRGLIRSECWHDDHPAPHTVLTRVDRLLASLQLPIMATATLLQLRPPATGGEDWTLECTNAGHPPVLVRRPDGVVEHLCDEHDLLLGTGMADLVAPRGSTSHSLTAGSQLLLYTDGLVEQPTPGRPGPERDLDAGVQRLEDLWAALPRAAQPAEVCDAVDALITDPADDIAVLVVQLGDRPGPAPRGP